MIRSGSAGLAALLSAASLMLGAAQADAGGGLGSVKVGAHGGTLGLGVSAGLDVSDRFVARGLINTFSLGFEVTESGNTFDADLDLQSVGLVGDWHPLDDGFRVTGGAFLNNNEVSATAFDQDLELGGRSYAGQIDMLLDFETFAPYLGAGWTSDWIGKPGWSFSVDAGLLYQQAPRLSASGTADGCSFSLSTGGDATVRNCPDSSVLEADLETEHADISFELEDFEWYPVLSIGVSYRY